MTPVAQIRGKRDTLVLQGYSHSLCMKKKNAATGDGPLIRRRPKPMKVAEEVTVTIRPHIDVLLSDTASIVGLELKNLANRSAEGAGLTREDIRLLATLTDSLTKLSREDRHRANSESAKIAELSDEELEELEGQLDD